MEYSFYFQTNLRATEIIDLFRKEGFTIRPKYFYVKISKDISITNPSHYAWLNFIEDYGNNQMTLQAATITGEKEEIIGFFKYFFNLTKMWKNFFEEPLEITLNHDKAKSIVIENEADIYEIFDENSPKIRSI